MKTFTALSASCLLFLGACAPNNPEPKESVEQASPAVPATGQEQAAPAADSRVAAGKEVYQRSCAGCHDSGTGGAPKPGNADDWKERIGLGVKMLTQRSIDGFEGPKGAMPPKGGNAELSDQEVGDAVLYMIDKVK